MAIPIIRPTAPALVPSPSLSPSPSTSTKEYHVYQVDTNSLSSSAAAYYSSAVNQDQNQVVSSSQYLIPVTTSSTNQQAPVTSSSDGSSTGASNSSSSDAASSDSNGKPPLSLAAVISIAVFSTLFIVGICYTCHRFRRRQRQRRTDRDKLTSSTGLDTGGSREKLQSRSQLGEGREERRLTERDLRGVLVPTITAPTAAIISPSSPSSSPSPFTPFNYNYGNPGPSHSRRSYQYPPPARSRTSRNRQSVATESTFTDHTEYDMLAMDGDSCARTLSTFSVDRSDADGANSEYDQRDLVSGTVAAPTAGHSQTTYTSTSSSFSHHAYGRDEKRSPSSPITPNGTWLNTNPPSSSLSSSTSPSPSTPIYPPSAYSQSLSPFNDPPLTSTSTSTSAHPTPWSATHPSWTEEDDQLVFAASASASASNGPSRTPSSAGLQRNVTIVRHQDARALQVDTPLGDDEEEEQVHLPPTYGELYGHT